ncbi:MAG: cadmium-translocating P-type ATPase [Paraglaciecola sp.]|nr:cadmium-translocating P-type ATPase [Paraglaciecola sp.]
MSNLCYHCGSENAQQNYSATVLAQSRYFCCPGCQGVAEAIVNNGLESYYQYRTEFASKAPSEQSDLLQSLHLHEDANIEQEFLYQDANKREINLSIAGINCAACGWLLERQVAKLPGVLSVSANVTAKRLLVSWDHTRQNLGQVLKRIEQIGYVAKPFQIDQHEKLHQQESKQLLQRLGLAGLMTMQVMMLNLGVFFDWFGHIDESTQQFFNWVSLVLSAPVALYSASGFYRSAWRAIKASTVNMDVPISLALILIFGSGCYATYTHSGQSYYESLCMFVFLLLISRYIEQNARFKAAQQSANLLSHMPTTATLVTPEGTRFVLAKQLVVGQKVLVKTGETVPIDGIVSEGTGQVDEAMLSGEFALVTKQHSAKVYAGTVLRTGTLYLTVTSTLSHAVISQINQLQLKALASKPRLAGLADRFAQYFVVAVLIVAFFTYLAWHWLAPEEAFWIAMSVLIATCPCALGLATPSSLSCAMGNLNRHGILIKRADVLEQLNKIDWIGLDKTGTLTLGNFSVQQSRNFMPYSAKFISQIAASLEQFSNHPIAKAFYQEGSATLRVEQAKEVVAKGIEATINQHRYRIGSRDFVNCAVPTEVATYHVFLSEDDQLIAAFLLQDTLRPNLPELLDRLRSKSLYLISGDEVSRVRPIAEQLHMTDWYAQQSPEDKLHKVIAAQQAGHSVMMLGDGINDAPVLAQADISVTLGMASDLAKSSADVILLNNELQSLPLVFTMAKRTTQNIKQNMAWALGYNMVVLPLAMIGWLTPWMAVIGMSLSSIIVVANAARLLRNKSEV